MNAELPEDNSNALESGEVFDKEKALAELADRYMKATPEERAEYDKRFEKLKAFAAEFKKK